MRFLSLALFSLILASCSISASVSTSFEAISGSLKSLSNSVTGDSASLDDYRRDVRAYASVFMDDGGSRDDFLRGLSDIAARHGVSDWEAQRITRVAIGEGLHDAGVDAEDVASLEDDWVRKGYRDLNG